VKTRSRPGNPVLNVSDVGRAARTSPPVRIDPLRRYVTTKKNRAAPGGRIPDPDFPPAFFYGGGYGHVYVGAQLPRIC
jgi:hypothetical protein